jgi:predicted ATPase with chaperone activity
MYPGVHAQTTPDKPAVIMAGSGRVITYQQLDDNSAALASACQLDTRSQDLLEQAGERLQLTARSLHRVLRVARTIADLAGSDAIATAHLTEAIGYRHLDRGEAPLARSA